MTTDPNIPWLIGLVVISVVGTAAATVAWRRITRMTREADRERLRKILAGAIRTEERR